MTTIDKRTSRPTTGIGSLPHHNVDAALAFAMRMGIPFLPQIPIRNPWEYMIAQALEGLPGLQVESDGSVFLHIDIWESRAHAFHSKLTEAFTHDANPNAFEDFEPSAASSSSWQAFLWELQEQEIEKAKIQIAGPMTAQWALRLKDGSSIDKQPELLGQIFRLVLARALAMSRRLQSLNIKPLLYLDEPGLFGLSMANPKHVLAIQELRLIIQTLRKEGVEVGLHCCSNTYWPAVLGLPLNYLSLDTALSLENLLQGHAPALETFVEGGGKLSLGVIPTGRSPAIHSLDVKELFAGLMEVFGKHWGGKPELVKKVIREAIYTPACGLALQSIADAEFILEALDEFYELACAR